MRRYTVLDYLTSNRYTLNRAAFTIGTILAVVLACAALYSLPPDDPQAVQRYLDQR